MSSESEQVLAAALALPPTERAALVDAILASFDATGRAEIDSLWAMEVEDRVAAFERGELGAVSADDVFDRINRGKPR